MTTKRTRPTPGQLVLVRHGQSDWNQKNLFTGWTDVDLTEQGRQEAQQAGRTLADARIAFDIAFTSVLVRAIRTLWLILDEMKLTWIPVENHWRLNERSYGALQGLDKAQTAAKHGADQVKIWRRSYDIPPPPLDESHEMFPGRDPRYASLSPAELPRAESLSDTVARFLPYYENAIAPALRRGERVLLAAHGNSLRALVKHLDGIGDDDIAGLNIPTGMPLVYRLDDDLRPTVAGGEYLDPDAARAAADAVANQGR